MSIVVLRSAMKLPQRNTGKGCGSMEIKGSAWRAPMGQGKEFSFQLYSTRALFLSFERLVCC